MAQSNNYPPIAFKIDRKEKVVMDKIQQIKQEAISEKDPQKAISLITGLTNFYLQEHNYQGDRENLTFKDIQARDDIGTMTLEINGDTDNTISHNNVYHIGTYRERVKVYDFGQIGDNELQVYLPNNESMIAVQYGSGIFYCKRQEKIMDKWRSNYSTTIYVPLTIQELKTERKDSYSLINIGIDCLPKELRPKNPNTVNIFKDNDKIKREQEISMLKTIYSLEKAVKDMKTSHIQTKTQTSTILSAEETELVSLINSIPFIRSSKNQMQKLYGEIGKPELELNNNITDKEIWERIKKAQSEKKTPSSSSTSNTSPQKTKTVTDDYENMVSPDSDIDISKIVRDLFECPEREEDNTEKQASHQLNMGALSEQKTQKPVVSSRIKQIKDDVPPPIPPRKRRNKLKQNEEERELYGEISV